MGSIKDFVSVAKIEPVEKQRAIAEELSELEFWNGQIHQLLAHQLLMYLKEVVAFG